MHCTRAEADSPRKAGLPWRVERYLPSELGGGEFPPILIRGGLMLVKDPPKRPDNWQEKGAVYLGLGAQGGWKFESSPDAALEEAYWRELRLLVAILEGKLGGGRAPGETLRDIWESELRHREQRQPKRIGERRSLPAPR